MNIYHIPYPKIINDSFTDKIFRHFDVLLGIIKEHKFVLSVSGGADSDDAIKLLNKYKKIDYCSCKSQS